MRERVLCDIGGAQPAREQEKQLYSVKVKVSLALSDAYWRIFRPPMGVIFNESALIMTCPQEEFLPVSQMQRSEILRHKCFFLICSPAARDNKVNYKIF
jgi:hypothetical protein